MEDVKTGRAGRVLFLVAGVLLVLVWLAAMSLDDDRLCTSVPLSFGFAGVLVLAVGGIVAGVRPARPTLTCLFGLGAGLYFLFRGLAGDMLSEIWRELPIILGAFTFYGAGYLVAQRRDGERILALALLLGVLVNVVYFCFVRGTDLPVELKGRPSMSLCGANTKGEALFFYRNFVAMYLLTASALLICRPFWTGWRGWGTLLMALGGMGGIICTCFTGSRATLGLLALMLPCAWVLWAIIRLCGKKEVGYGLVLSGLALFVGFGVLLGELFMGDTLLAQIAATDSHGRVGLWREMSSLLPELPWCGYGAGASTWYTIPITSEYWLPNYAHNEYLQAWVDYGMVGLLLMLAVLMAHLSAGFWTLASEEVGRERKPLAAACMFLLLAYAGCAVFDFVWHNVALAGLAAFCCGALASPIPTRRDSFFSKRQWAPGSRPSLRPVRPMGRSLTSICCIGCLTLAAGCGFFGYRLLPAWLAEWEYNALCRAGATNVQRAAFLEKVMPFYPDPTLADHYVTLRLPSADRKVLARKEAMLRMALESNPHQMFTLVMLADVLGRQGRYAEAEALMRDNFLPDGQRASDFANWPAYYGLNLLYWGRQRMVMGDRAAALSMMEYALKLSEHAGKFRHISVGARDVQAARNKATAAYLEARRVDVTMLRSIGVQKDDSWMQPMRPGGSPALYQRWVVEEGEKTRSQP